ncbi:MAG: tetratricopeptide repeat protein [Chitinophagales bacterium]
MKSLSLVVIFVVSQFFLLGQNNKEQAYKYGREAIRLMDEEKDYKEAIKLLQKAQALDEDNILYSYEIAYAYYIQKRYETAINFLRKLQRKDGFNERFFRLLGTCYDLSEDVKKAENTYLDGIEYYPFSGELYTEMGGLQYRKGNIDRAVNYWEMGIRRDPNFASNYYWAAKMYLNSSEKVWGVFYGELFMNLERNSKRTSEMGEMLFEAYQGAFHPENDSIGWFSLSERARTYRLLMFEDQGQVPFQVAYGEAFEEVYDKWLKADSTATSKTATLSIGDIATLRTLFTQYWFDHNRYTPYPNILLDWHKILIDKGYFEAYHYWLLMKGDSDAFGNWGQTHQKVFSEFMSWFKENPLRLNEHKKFHRLQYVEGNQPLKDF